MGVWGLGFGVCDAGSGVWGLGFGVGGRGLGFGFWVLGFGVGGLLFGVDVFSSRIEWHRLLINAAFVRVDDLIPVSAAEQEGNNFEGFKALCLKMRAIPGHDMALTVFFLAKFARGSS